MSTRSVLAQTSAARATGSVAQATDSSDGLGPMIPFADSQTQRLAVLSGLGLRASVSESGLSCDLSWTVSLV